MVNVCDVSAFAPTASKTWNAAKATIKVMSVYSMMYMGLGPFGALFAGFMADDIGAPDMNPMSAQIRPTSRQCPNRFSGCIIIPSIRKTGLDSPLP